MKKRINLPVLLIPSILLMVMAAGAVSCNHARNLPGWDYFPDMFYSTAYETFSRNPNFPDGITMRVPVAGTVPQGFMPFGYTIDDESRIRAGKELVNPFTPDSANLKIGRELFTIFCIDCHGSSGEGNGYLYTSGLYPVKPRSLIATSAVTLRDGELFHSITLGFGSMGAYGSQIAPDDRWKVVLYLRKLQGQSGN